MNKSMCAFNLCHFYSNFTVRSVCFDFVSLNDNVYFARELLILYIHFKKKNLIQCLFCFSFLEHLFRYSWCSTPNQMPMPVDFDSFCYCDIFNSRHKTIIKIHFKKCKISKQIAVLMIMMVR